MGSIGTSWAHRVSWVGRPFYPTEDGNGILATNLFRASKPIPSALPNAVKGKVLSARALSSLSLRSNWFGFFAFFLMLEAMFVFLAVVA